jgi:hypothetical protein
MSTSLQVQTSESNDSGQWLWSAVCAKTEAQSLFTAVQKNSDTIESIRDLIAVPPHIESALRLYACEHPEEATEIEGVFRFRRRVGGRIRADDWKSRLIMLRGGRDSIQAP